MSGLELLPLAGGALSGIGSLVGGSKGSSAATSAAKVQAQAAQQSAALQYHMFNQYQGNLAPYMGFGQQALGQLAGGLDLGGNSLTSPLLSPGGYSGQFSGYGAPYSTPAPTAPGGAMFSPTNMGLGGSTFEPSGIGLSFAPTMEQLKQTPGYQFSLDQGLQGVQNSAAAQGLGSSGAALKGAATFAEGLAGNTFQSQFQNWLQTLQQQYGMFSGQQGQQYNMFSGSLGQQAGIWQTQNALALQKAQQNYNMLGGVAGSGQNAGVNLGTAGMTAAGQAGNLLTSGAAATAGGIVGSTNALNAGMAGASSGIGSGINNYLMYNLLTNPNGGAGSQNPLMNLTGLNPSQGNDFGGGSDYFS